VRDELNEPLGLAPNPAASHGGRWRANVLAGAAGLAAALALFGLARREAPVGGESFAAAKVEAAKVEIAPPPIAAPAPSIPASTADPALPPIASADQVEAASGVKVTRSGGSGAPSALIIDVPQALGLKLEAAPDRRLSEKSRYGLLPRIGADGARPFDVYARPIFLASKLKPGGPRVAVMVGGLGLNAEGTQTAISRLPGAVTLGFAPYGAAIEQQAADAREAGHETVLQAPMEGFSNRADDPGPHMLKTGASEVDNLESLRWLMGRFTGYVAVVNYLGGRFTADQRAAAPIVGEIAARGLGYFDDGSSPRSVTLDIAATLAMPSGRADVDIDSNPAPEAVDAALTRLLDLARERGAAIGVASASPMCVERLTRWAATLESKGVALVPLSALMSKVPGPSAQFSKP
jgi:uncharacterized protein